MAFNMKSSKQDQQNEDTPLIGDQRHYGSSDPISALDPQNLHLRGPGGSLPYNDYNTIDWLQDLIRDSKKGNSSGFRLQKGLRDQITELFTSAEGWIAAFTIGALTAIIASIVDVSVETVADWKDGYCTEKIWLNHRACCSLDDQCQSWKPWSESFGLSYGVYVGLSLIFGIIAVKLTVTTKRSLPTGDNQLGKTLYMASGSGIPEIKTILSGFTIPNFFDLKVMVVKAIGAIFAVATGMCLGKEGPFVHISGCVGYLVTMCIPKYATSERKLREMLSVACSAGLSVAFGAPIGGVLFSYEEISTYFPRQVLWKSCLCSMVAAAVLKELNPAGTGKLVLFETNYGVNYDFVHYLLFIFLGICGGIFGGVFCQANFRWSKSIRQYSLVKNNPVYEVCAVVLITALSQYPNPLTRETGDISMQRLLVDCNNIEEDWLCRQEALPHGKGLYYVWLLSGTFVKLLLTTITFGCKVPSGIIIPAMDAGALFGRLVGQMVPNVSPGIFAMVGSAAFLAGVSRMTVSLAVIMFELTGEVNFIPPFIIAILTAKWVADRIKAEGVYDLAQDIQGHPFLDPERALKLIRKLRDAQEPATLQQLLSSIGSLEDNKLPISPNYEVPTSVLRERLTHIRNQGLTDTGLVFTNDSGICHGYLPKAGIDHALQTSRLAEEVAENSDMTKLTEDASFEHLDQNPLTISANAPLEFAVEIFSKLGISSLIVAEEGTSKAVGVISKKQLLSFFDKLR